MKTIEFKIIYAPNIEIYQSGYVEIPDDENEEVEWHYTNQQGFTQSNQFTHHDGIGLTQIGATDEQQAEIDKFLELINIDLIDWVQDVIIFATEDECSITKKGDITICIGDVDENNSFVLGTYGDD